MGWTLTGCAFQHNGLPTQVFPRGNNAAWICPKCGSQPILFVYRGVGGRSQRPVHCPGCNTPYYLDPQFGATPEPPAGHYAQPSPTMTIV